MNKVLGLGVFGTFGQPQGFEQAFNADVQFVHSLDLDSNEIELFPNTELFAVKKEVVRGVYSVCFCMYSYARELNANRSTTFLGSCIVLQQVYIEPDKVYKLLRELHNDLVNNTQNINNNTIQVRRVVNLVVREPSQFQSFKFGTKALDDTPYYSTSVNPEKRYFVKTEHIESASQVVNFFDEALKNFNDVESLYFTFSDKVINSVIKKGNLEVIDWSEFVNYKNLVQEGVVRTKKGLKPSPMVIPPMPATDAKPVTAFAAETKSAEAVKKEPVRTEPVNTEPVAAPPKQAEPVIQNDDFPFDGWGEPDNAWGLDEALKRVHEYNRLLEYAKHLKAHNDDLLEQEREIIARYTAVPENIEPNVEPNQVFPDSIPLGGSGDNEEEDELKEKKPFYKNQYFPLIAFGVALLIMISAYLVVNKRLFRKPIPSAYDIPETTQPVDSVKPAEQPSKQDAAQHGGKDTDAAQQQKPVSAKALNPETNFELPVSEVMTLSRAGIKNKSLPDITNMIFQKFPVDIGDIYKHQFGNYSMNLLMANRNAFQQKGADYICITDTIMHIPAYKSPKTTVAFPK